MVGIGGRQKTVANSGEVRYKVGAQYSILGARQRTCRAKNWQSCESRVRQWQHSSDLSVGGEPKARNP